MSETFICSHCGQEHPITERIVFDDHELCRDCYDSQTCICDHCGDRIWAEDSCGDEPHTLCRDYESRYYDRCTDCGRLVLNEDLLYLSDDDDEGYCEYCYDLHNTDQGICDYDYKPEPIFYGSGPRYLGVELEIDGGGEEDRKATQIQDVGNELFEHIYIKHDGSLDDGLEIVTHPMTLDCQRQ